MIKMVAIDIDGTLLTDDNKLTQKTKQIISEVRAKGIKVVLCSGRPTAGIINIAKELDLDKEDELVISFNGAVTEELKNNRVLFKSPLTFEEFVEIENLSREIGVSYHIQSDDGIYTTNQDVSYYTLYDSWLNNVNLKVRTLAELKTISINKILFVASPEEMDYIIRKVPYNLNKKYHLMKSLDCFFEFISKDTNKGLALKRIANKLGFQPDEVMAIGDNDNDISMLTYAGMGVAMGNASEKAKKASKFITKSNNEDGVAFALQKWIV